MNRRPLVRTLLASAAIAAAIALAGCDTDGTPSVGGRHLQPLSDRMVAEIENKNMEKELPILVRIFKEESELEVWKEDKTGRFALLKTYPICRWSGDLGPKIKEGDRQAPEGFYTITPGLMNPNSSYYLAINTGFPNAYDRANGRTGGFLMIHGDCSSRGCYAMTDEQIAEIYALARELFFGGQKSFQIQAYPFRMTPINMAKHRNSPHMAFWKMLKQGYDHFEVTRLEPKVDVCEKRYVFDAETSAKFSAADRCPAYKVPEDIAAAVRDKQRRDDDPDRRADQPRHARRPGQDGRRRRHEPDLPGGREVQRRAGRHHPHGGRDHPRPRQPAGRAERRDDRKHVPQPLCRHPEPRVHRIEAGRDAALVNVQRRRCRSRSRQPRAGSAASSAICSDRRARSRRELRRPKPEASAPKSKPAAAPSRRRPRSPPRNPRRRSPSRNSRAPRSKPVAGRVRRPAPSREQAGQHQRPAHRRSPDRALGRLREPLRRLALIVATE